MNWFDRFLNSILKFYGIPFEEPQPRPGLTPPTFGPDFIPAVPHDPGYWAFTLEFDEECTASSLASRLPQLDALETSKLEAARAELADPIAPSTAIAARIVGPVELPSVVTLLIDHSGSMRGKMRSVVSATNLVVRSLLAAGVRVEVLGFTTKSWKGGAAWDVWTRQGRPKAPGRLCDVRHIVYRSADDPETDVVNDLMLMLRDGVLRENIDGEALQWAVRRIRARPERRKLLIVVSDGAPVDDSTDSCNRPKFLSDHLRYVVQSIERAEDITLASIGLGHDTSGYYKDATLVEEQNFLPTIVDLLANWMTNQGPASSNHTIE